MLMTVHSGDTIQISSYSSHVRVFIVHRRCNFASYVLLQRLGEGILSIIVAYYAFLSPRQSTSTDAAAEAAAADAAMR